jgi:hypothetical protein
MRMIDNEDKLESRDDDTFLSNQLAVGYGSALHFSWIRLFFLVICRPYFSGRNRR